MDIDTFTDHRIIEFSKENFINLKMNVDTQYGREIFDQFHGVSLPTILFLNPNGEEIDRFIGYYNSDDYFKKINDIKNNINTLEYFLKQYELYPDSGNIALQIGNKYLERKKIDTAKKYFENVLKSNDSKSSQEANYKLAFLEYENQNFEPILSFIDNHPNSDFTYSAIRSMTRYYRGILDTVSEITYYEKLIEYFPTDINALNSYAWRMSELNINLGKALKTVQKAVDLSSDSPSSQANILDTEAEVLWKLGRIEEAIIIINKAIIIDPDYTYFQEQKKKFLDSK